MLYGRLEITIKFLYLSKLNLRISASIIVTLLLFSYFLVKKFFKFESFSIKVIFFGFFLI